MCRAEAFLFNLRNGLSSNPRHTKNNPSLNNLTCHEKSMCYLVHHVKPPLILPLPAIVDSATACLSCYHFY